MENEIEESKSAQRLPLWKNCLEAMLKKGVSHGQIWDADFFEKELKCQKNTMGFGLGISNIRRALEDIGFYLDGRGGNGERFAIVPPAENSKVMANKVASALDELRRAYRLGAATRVDMLTIEERGKHERAMERVATRLALMTRAKAITNILTKERPNLLKF